MVKGKENSQSFLTTPKKRDNKNCNQKGYIIN